MASEVLSLTRPIELRPVDQDILLERLSELGESDRVASFLSFEGLLLARTSMIQNGIEYQRVEDGRINLRKLNPWEAKVTDALRRQKSGMNTNVDFDQARRDEEKLLVEYYCELAQSFPGQPDILATLHEIKAKIRTTEAILEIDQFEKDNIKSGRQGAVSTTEGEE